ncbi:MAG: substrate-binding domain-containing protein [Dehalococcoidia bacterium]|nr:substrate-binding domain-containing protein [Dehalococcoidia bacterium]
MRKLIKWMPALLAAIFLLVSTVGCNAKEITLKVFAAQSLQKALTEINDLYIQQNSNIKIGPNFDGSGTLQWKIENAAPGQADIFISAAAAQMDNLQNKNLLLGGSRKNLLEQQYCAHCPQR